MRKPIQSAVVTLAFGKDTLKRRVKLSGYLSADGSEMLPYVVGDRIDEGSVWEGWRVEEISKCVTVFDGDGPLPVYAVRPPNFDGEPDFSLAPVEPPGFDGVLGVVEPMSDLVEDSAYTVGFNAGLEAAAEIVQPDSAYVEETREPSDIAATIRGRKVKV